MAKVQRLFAELVARLKWRPDAFCNPHGILQLLHHFNRESFHAGPISGKDSRRMVSLPLFHFESFSLAGCTKYNHFLLAKVKEYVLENRLIDF